MLCADLTWLGKDRESELGVMIDQARRFYGESHMCMSICNNAGVYDLNMLKCMMFNSFKD